MYKYILFDLDGTMTDSHLGITRSVKYALASFGIEADEEDLLCFIGPPLRESFMKYYDMDRETAEKAVVKYRERFGKIGLFENEVLPGIPELLARLKKRGHVLAVATSKPEIYTVQILEKFGLMPYFTVCVGCFLDGTREDKAEVIAEVLNRLGVAGSEKKQAVMVGDRHHDIEGAKKNGIDSIGVTFGFAEDGELENAGATYLAGDTEELFAILDGGSSIE